MGETPKPPTFFIQDPLTQKVEGPLTVQQLKQWYSGGSVGLWGVAKTPNGPWTPAAQVKGLARPAAGSVRLLQASANVHMPNFSGGADNSPPRNFQAESRLSSPEVDPDSLGRLFCDIFFAIKAKMLEARDQPPAPRRKPTSVSTDESSVLADASAPTWAWVLAVGLLVCGFVYTRNSVTEWADRRSREAALAANRREQNDAERREKQENERQVRKRGQPTSNNSSKTSDESTTPSEWLKRSGRTKSDAVEFVFFPRAGDLSASISLINNSHTPVWATMNIESSALGSSFVDGLLYDVKPGRKDTCTVKWTGPVPADLWERSVFNVTIEDLDAKLSEDRNGMDLTRVLRPILYVRANDLPRVRSSDCELRVLE